MKYQILSTLLSTFVFSNFAFGFTLNSTSNSDLKGWSQSEVKFYVNLTNCPSSVDVVGMIKEAANVWNNVPTSSIKVSYGGTTTSDDYTNPPTVYCETDFATVTKANANFVPGAASVQAPSGRISSGLLILNVSSGQANIANYDKTKLTLIVAHEIGHVLGLGHSDSTNALMYYDATAKEELNLSQDDIDGMSYLYPSNEFDGEGIAGCGTVSQKPPQGPFQALVILLLISLPILISRKLKYKV